MGLRLITPPTDFPVTLAEANTFLRADGDDDRVTAILAAATDYVEKYIGRCIASQTWELALDQFSSAIQLPLGPVTSVASVKYFDADSIEQTVGADYYSTDLVSDPQWIVLNAGFNWPTTATGINVVTILFVAGYATTPPAIKQAILLLISQWYDMSTTLGSNMAELPHAVSSLLANFRAYAF